MKFVHCSSNPYMNQSSIVYIHPFQFPGIAIAIHFSCFDSVCDYCDQQINCYSFYCNANRYSGLCPNYAFNDCDYLPPGSSCPGGTCAKGREGILCGNCSDGYAVAINDPDLSCIKCNYQYGVAIIIFITATSTSSDYVNTVGSSSHQNH